MPVPALAGTRERDDDDVADAHADRLVAARACVGLHGGSRLDVADLGSGTCQRIDGEAPRRTRTRTRARTRTSEPRSVRGRRDDTPPRARAAGSGVTAGHDPSISRALRPPSPTAHVSTTVGVAVVASIAVQRDLRSAGRPMSPTDSGGPGCWRAFIRRH